MNPSMHKAILEEVSWDDALSSIKQVKPELAELIEERKPNKRYNLIHAKYPYGTDILKDGILHIPNSQGEVVSLAHSSIEPSIRDKLAYSGFPLGIITRNSMEVSRMVEGRIITLQFFLPGVIMGLWESLDPPKSNFPTHIWSVTSGARCIFVLPKIQDAIYFSRLRKEFDLPNQIPKEIPQQWNIFKRIANHPNFNESWYSEIYFFPQQWMENNKKDMDWVKFHHFLLDEAWQLSSYARNARNQDFMWDYFARKLSEKGYKPSPQHVEILKHIMSIALGGIPGIKAAGISEIAAPVKGLQDALIQDYGLKRYVPTVMHPYPFLMDAPDGQPVYYSCHVNNLLTSLPASRSPYSTINELYNLHELLEHLLEEAHEESAKIENTYIADMVKKVSFSFFHSDIAKQGGILHTSKMPEGDNNLISLDEKYGERFFAETAHFIRGCIRVSQKK